MKDQPECSVCGTVRLALNNAGICEQCMIEIEDRLDDEDREDQQYRR